MNILETRRLRMRPIRLEDARFLCEIFNQPSWLAFIGDRGVRSEQDARHHIQTKTFAHYSEHGFGMNVAESLEDGTPVGMCGLVQRDYLPTPDLGYALLERHWGRGYAREMASAVVSDAFQRLSLPCLYAIVLPENVRSVSVLDALHFRLEDPGFGKPGGETVNLYALHAPATGAAATSA